MTSWTFQSRISSPYDAILVHAFCIAVKISFMHLPPWHGCQVTKNKRPNLAINLKKTKFSNWKMAKFSKKISQNISNKFLNYLKNSMFFWYFAKIGNFHYFLQDQKRPNGQIILCLENCFKNGQMATLLFDATTSFIDI